MMDSGTKGVDAGGAADIPDLLASSPELVTHSDGARPTESSVTHDRAPEPPPEPGIQWQSFTKHRLPRKQ